MDNCPCSLEKKSSVLDGLKKKEERLILILKV
jgi:redox-regulated HSP33 family molecular chaperone